MGRGAVLSAALVVGCAPTVVSIPAIDEGAHVLVFRTSRSGERAVGYAPSEDAAPIVALLDALTPPGDEPFELVTAIYEVAIPGARGPIDRDEVGYPPPPPRSALRSVIVGDAATPWTPVDFATTPAARFRSARFPPPFCDAVAEAIAAQDLATIPAPGATVSALVGLPGGDALALTISLTELTTRFWRLRGGEASPLTSTGLEGVRCPEGAALAPAFVGATVTSTGAIYLAGGVCTRSSAATAIVVRAEVSDASVHLAPALGTPAPALRGAAWLAGDASDALVLGAKGNLARRRQGEWTELRPPDEIARFCGGATLDCALDDLACLLARSNQELAPCGAVLAQPGGFLALDPTGERLHELDGALRTRALELGGPAFGLAPGPDGPWIATRAGGVAGPSADDRIRPLFSAPASQTMIALAPLASGVAMIGLTGALRLWSPTRGRCDASLGAHGSAASARDGWLHFALTRGRADTEPVVVRFRDPTSM